MALTPVELRHISFGRRPFGYARQEVDRAVEEAVAGYEAVWRERADLADKVEHLEAELARHRDLESLLRTTLVSAERNAEELKAQAKREADVVLEARRVRTLLTAALDAVVESAPLEAVAADDDDPDANGAPRREAA